MTDEYLETMVRLACEIADGDAASLFIVDGDVLRPYIIYNLPREYVEGIGEVRIGTQCCGRAVEHKKPWIVTDMLKDPLFSEGREGASKSFIRAAFSVPVFGGSAVIASLACHFAKPHTPTALDIDRNEHFAKLIAITIKDRELQPRSLPLISTRDRIGAANNDQSLTRGDLADSQGRLVVGFAKKDAMEAPVAQKI